MKRSNKIAFRAVAIACMLMMLAAAIIPTGAVEATTSSGKWFTDEVDVLGADAEKYIEETAAEIDEEIKSIICDAYDKTKKVLSEHIDLLHRLAGVLFEREKLDADEFLDVMNGKLLPSAQTAAAGIIPAEAAAPETTELPTEAQTEPEANTNE